MSREKELFAELRAARSRLRREQDALDQARKIVREQERLIEDILVEIDTGKACDNGTNRPLIDAIQQNNEAARTAALDTALANIPPHVEWTSADLEIVLKAAAWPRDEIWNEFLETGCDDLKILEVLRAIWPGSPQFMAEPRPGITIQGGAVPKIWVGARRQKDQVPTLAGLELADRLRTVLMIPRLLVKVVPDQVLDTEKAATRPRKRKAKP